MRDLGPLRIERTLSARIIPIALGGALLLLTAVPKAVASEKLSWVEDKGKGTLTVKEGGIDVLTYRFGDQLPGGVDPRFTRSCYIHPLCSLDGQPLTADFPGDHLHHHGVFWTWPAIMVRGTKTQTWHPDSLRQYFSRWLERRLENGTAVLGVENAWRLEGKEIVAEETVTIRVHPVAGDSRAVDMDIVLRAVGGPLELRGAPEEDKGYGGLCLRGAPIFTGADLTTDRGPQREDSVDRRFRWADLSTLTLGIAVFVSPDHPGFPTTWLIRNSYAGILNPSWPGLDPAILSPGAPVRLGYRIYIHRGDAISGRVKEAYEEYAAGKR